MNNLFSDIIPEFHLPLTNPVLVFSLILFIILLSPILLRKISIPGIIGLIISGVIIGPFGFNILEKNAAVDLFSTIGLLYIMFIAGLDLDLNQFKANRNKSILFGFMTFAVPLVTGFPVCYYFLGYPFNSSLLLASMFATQTLIAYPIVSKLGIAKHEPVAITVGGTIFTDTAVLLLLVVIMGNVQGAVNSFFWLRLSISLILFFFVMFWIVPRVAKWFFRKLESEKHSHYIFVLAVVFFAAFLAELSGIEPIIGAFVAGLALNRLIPHSSALMNRIEFIGNSLFIPFFLISVGMIVDVSVLFNGYEALKVIVTLSVVALIGKWLAAYFTQKILSYTALQRNLIFGLSSSHAAAILAVALVGYKAGILDDNVLNGTVILILVTCMVASFVTESAARRIAVGIASDYNLKNQAAEFISEKILIPVANIANVSLLIELATFIKNKKAVNPISVLSCVPNDDNAEENVLNTKNKLEQYIEEAAASEQKLDIIVTLDHNPASGIARTSKEIMADIIIMGWPQRAGMLDKIVGDKAENVVGNTDKTVFICYLNKTLVSCKRILLFVPPMAENESGFTIWLSKMFMLATELSLPVICYAGKDTVVAMSEWAGRKASPVPVDFSVIDDWNDILIARDIRRDDILIVVSARKGSVSHLPAIDALPAKLEKFYEQNTKLLIYPQRFAHHYKVPGYENFTTGPLSDGIDMVQKLGRDISTVFKGSKK